LAEEPSIRELVEALAKAMGAAGLQLFCARGRWAVAYTDNPQSLTLGEVDALCAMRDGTGLVLYVPGNSSWDTVGIVAILSPGESRLWPIHATEDVERSIREFLHRAIDACDRLAAYRRL